MAGNNKSKGMIQKAIDAVDHAIHPNHDEDLDLQVGEEIADEEVEQKAPVKHQGDKIKLRKFDKFKQEKK
jgi:hypothetical protein